MSTYNHLASHHRWVLAVAAKRKVVLTLVQ